MDMRAAGQGRLQARPERPSSPGSHRIEGPPGLHPLGLGSSRDGLIYVPGTYDSERPAPLVLLLHGASGSGRSALNPLLDLADETGLILLAPDARGPTWDVLLRGYGPDVAFIDAALRWTFDRYAIQRGRLAIEGFSDGASYALSLGLTNGGLFGHVIAFSPGFLAPAGREGRPRIFISHGIHDAVLPIDVCSRLLVPLLRGSGYSVHYREFDGPHRVPADIAREAVDWFLAGGGG